MHERVKAYISAALDRHYPLETIIGNLVSAGHDKETVKRLARETIRERIDSLQREIAPDPITASGSAARRATMEIVGIIFRVAVGTMLFFALAPEILRGMYT
jgi:hypothetical protein